MEEQLKENPEVLLKEKISDLQKENFEVREENSFLQKTILKIRNQMMVLQEFVLPGNERIHLLSHYLKEWKNRHTLQLQVNAELEVDLGFAKKKILELENRPLEKIIVDLKKDKEKLIESSTGWHGRYQKYYAENIKLERVIEKHELMIIKLKDQIDEYERIIHSV